MKEPRYADITAHLSFAPRGTASGWAKLEWLDGVIKAACQKACGITQHCAVDESMIKCLSRYCPWIQYMPKKPIKRGKFTHHTHTHPTHHYPIYSPTGVKVFCLVLGTGFLYNWHVYRGQQDPLAGPDYMYRLIFDTLLHESSWDFCNAVIFFDAAFTGFRLARDLFNKRGISFVGPINASKPEKGGGPNSWPHQKFKARDTNFLPRGWDRVAFNELESGGWLQVFSFTP